MYFQEGARLIHPWNMHSTQRAKSPWNLKGPRECFHSLKIRRKKNKSNPPWGHKIQFLIFFNGGRGLLNPKRFSPPESKWLWRGGVTCPRSTAARSWQTGVQMSPYPFPEYHWASPMFMPHKTQGISRVLECSHHLTFFKLHFLNTRLMKLEMFFTRLNNNVTIALVTEP